MKNWKTTFVGTLLMALHWACYSPITAGHINWLVAAHGLAYQLFGLVSSDNVLTDVKGFLSKLFSKKIVPEIQQPPIKLKIVTWPKPQNISSLLKNLSMLKIVLSLLIGWVTDPSNMAMEVKALVDHFVKTQNADEIRIVLVNLKAAIDGMIQANSLDPGIIAGLKIGSQAIQDAIDSLPAPAQKGSI